MIFAQRLTENVGHSSTKRSYFRHLFVVAKTGFSQYLSSIPKKTSDIYISMGFNLQGIYNLLTHACASQNSDLRFFFECACTCMCTHAHLKMIVYNYYFQCACTCMRMCTHAHAHVKIIIYKYYFQCACTCMRMCMRAHARACAILCARVHAHARACARMRNN